LVDAFHTLACDARCSAVRVTVMLHYTMIQ
jgi:hypothetical protein